ncbi:MAG: hypothetical protein AAF447_03945 [Myxococcota bacterium]
MPRRFLLPRGACFGALFALAACGASPRMMHEGRVYYERCYAADRDAARSDDERLGCWDAWLAHYALAQPPEQVAYARARREALASGRRDPARVPHLPSGRPESRPRDTVDPLGEVRDPSIPQGNVDDRLRVPLRPEPIPYADRARPPAPPPAPPPSPPTRLGQEPCLGVCDPEWARCVATCPDRGMGCRNACVASYHLCMDGCG